MLRNSQNEFLPASQQLTHKINHIFATLPPDQSSCRQWGSYELHCGDFWGDNAEKITLQPEQIETMIFEPAKEILQTHIGFLIAHNQTVLDRVKKNFVNARVIKLVNYEDFRARAVKLKTGTPPPHGRLNDTVSADFEFDMQTIFDWPLFKQELSRCVNCWGFESEFDDRLEEFYHRYISLHL